MTTTRSVLSNVALDSAGNGLGGATITVYELGTTTPISETMYAAATGGTTKSNPFTADSLGRYLAWIPGDGKLVSVKATKNGQTYTIVDAFVPVRQGQFFGPSPWIDVRAYGATFDGILRLNGTTASGSPALTVPLGGAHTGFVQATHAGMRCVVVEVTGSGNSAVETNRFAGTILSVQSPTEVTLSGNVSATLSGTAKVYWGTDDSAAIQAAIDAAVDASVATEIRMPHGIAMVATGLDYQPSTIGGRIVGQGSMLDASHVETGTVLVGATASMVVLTLHGNHITAENFAIDGAGKLATTGIGTLTDGAIHWSTFRQVRVAACVNGFSLDYEQFATGLYDCVGIRCTYGLLMPRTNGALAIQKVNLFNCSFEVNSAAGAKLTSCELVTFFGGTMGHSPIGLQVTSSTDIHAIGVMFESCSTAGVDYVKASDASGTQSVINSNLFGNWFTSCAYAVQAKGAREVRAIGNKIHNGTTAAANYTDSGQTNAVNLLNQWYDNSIVSTSTVFAASDGLLRTSFDLQSGPINSYKIASRDTMSLRVVNDKAYSNGNLRSAMLAFATNNPSSSTENDSVQIIAEMTPSTGVGTPNSELVFKMAHNALGGQFEALRIGTDRLTLRSTGPQIIFGSGSPESAITAPVGSLWLRTDGGANTTVYVKESGSGSTGWVAK